MLDLSFKEMEDIMGGCPGIGCAKVFNFAVCYDACDGEILYIEAW